MKTNDTSFAMPRRSIFRAAAGALAVGAGLGHAQSAPDANNQPVTPTPLARSGGALDVNRAQVMFVDLQPGLIAGSRTTPPKELAIGVGALAKAAQILTLPMTFSLVPDGRGWGRALPELRPYFTKENAFWRTSAGAFMDQLTVDHVNANSRKLLILSGFAAEVVVCCILPSVRWMPATRCMCL